MTRQDVYNEYTQDGQGIKGKKKKIRHFSRVTCGHIVPWKKAGRTRFVLYLTRTWNVVKW